MVSAVCTDYGRNAGDIPESYLSAADMGIAAAVFAPAR